MRWSSIPAIPLPPPLLASQLAYNNHYGRFAICNQSSTFWHFVFAAQNASFVNPRTLILSDIKFLIWRTPKSMRTMIGNRKQRPLIEYSLEKLAQKLISEGPHKYQAAGRRVRGLFNSKYAFDTTKAYHVWEHQYYPQYGTSFRSQKDFLKKYTDSTSHSRASLPMPH